MQNQIKVTQQKTIEILVNIVEKYFFNPWSGSHNLN